MADLKTDYENDVLDTDVNTERTYDIVDENENTLYTDVKIRETTVLSKVGDNYGAIQINEQNEKINQINTALQTKANWNTDLGSITSFNNLKTQGIYRGTSALADCPSDINSNWAFLCTVTVQTSNNTIRQDCVFFLGSSQKHYVRVFWYGTWNNWEELVKKSDADIQTITLQGSNGTRSWGYIAKTGRICMLCLSGYTDKAFEDNTSYELSANVTNAFQPLNNQPLVQPQGNWNNETTPKICEIDINANNKLLLTPLNGTIASGYYISMTVTYISKE